MKSLDEAIQHCLEVAEQKETKAKYCFKTPWESDDIAKDCVKCAEEHRQLADWLRELKERREQHEVIRCKDCKYYYNTDPESIPTANIICSQMHEDDYCSYAERKEECTQ